VQQDDDYPRPILNIHGLVLILKRDIIPDPYSTFIFMIIPSFLVISGTPILICIGTWVGETDFQTLPKATASKFLYHQKITGNRTMS
jgi:hypothetical protein